MAAYSRGKRAELCKEWIIDWSIGTHFQAISVQILTT